MRGIEEGKRYVEAVVFAAEAVEEEVSVDLRRDTLASVRFCFWKFGTVGSGREREAYLRLDQHQVDEQHHEVVLDVFVGEALAPRALRQPHALAQRPVIRCAVGVVQLLDRIRALDAYWHCGRRRRGIVVCLLDLEVADARVRLPSGDAEFRWRLASTSLRTANVSVKLQSCVHCALFIVDSLIHSLISYIDQLCHSPKSTSTCRIKESPSANETRK